MCIYSDYEKAYELYEAQYGKEDEDEQQSIKTEMKSIKTKLQTVSVLVIHSIYICMYMFLQAKVQLKRSKRKDLYAILGVASTATVDDIKKAYKKKALLYHPDRNAGATEEKKAENEAIFKTINQAYEILVDKEKKALYDQGVCVCVCVSVCV